MLKQLLKYLFFLIHTFFILVSIIFCFFYWQVLILQLIAILSWQLNDKKCILTQIEDYLFNESIIDYYFKLIGNNNNNYTKFIVPKYQRYLVYFLFTISSIYWSVK